MNISIVYQSKDWLIINKPAGLSVHNDPGADVCSFLQQQLSSKIYPVHRLDKNTSGLMICALRNERVVSLQRSLQTGEKTYHAIVRGQISEEKGVWKTSISDRAEGRRNPRGKSQDRKEAETSYSVIKKNDYLSMIACTLHTGRQHQIRKHCVLGRHEIIGDMRYGERKYQEKLRARYKFEHMALHARELVLNIAGKEKRFHAPIPLEWKVFELC